MWHIYPHALNIGSCAHLDSYCVLSSPNFTSKVVFWRNVPDPSGLIEIALHVTNFTHIEIVDWFLIAFSGRSLFVGEHATQPRFRFRIGIGSKRRVGTLPCCLVRRAVTIIYTHKGWNLLHSIFNTSIIKLFPSFCSGHI